MEIACEDDDFDLQVWAISIKDIDRAKAIKLLRIRLKLLETRKQWRASKIKSR
jgi:hypothetical protein